MTRIFIYFLLFAFLCSCTTRQKADLILHNAVVYTVDSNFTVAEALVVSDGKFVETGKSADILNKYEAVQTIDAGGKPVYPGFIDAHCHFLRYGLSLGQVDLTGTSSYNEVIEKVIEHRKKYPGAAWIEGRGWDQNDWNNKNFPEKDTLDQLFPDTPVLLTRIDGHAALVNQQALDMAGVTPGMQVSGGVIESKNGKLTGILIDNAIGLVQKAVPLPTRSELVEGLQQAEKNCLAVGLTTINDAGLDKLHIDLMDSLYKVGQLNIRAYVMVNPSQENQNYYFENGPYRTDHLNVRSFKIYADGALGSRGACLLEDYHDSPGNKGFLLKTPEELKNIAVALYQHNFQMNTHCIGDSANRLLLDLYGEVLKGKNDRRWRIEHAQVVSTTDSKKFGEYSIIPSVQPTHATSDMYWAHERLGNERVKTAYPYQDLLNQIELIAIGSDFPVEDINPLYGFHAAVARQDARNYPPGGYQIENAISRENALRGMTIWAAYSSFEETEKGSIEGGKFADFVILDADIMKANPAKLRNVAVHQTFLAGKSVYTRESNL